VKFSPDTTLIVGILGAVIALGGAFVHDVVPDDWRFRKMFVLLAIVLGAVVAIVSAFQQHNDTVEEKSKNETMRKEIHKIGYEADLQTGIIQKVHSDTGQANILAPGNYAVQISAGSTSDELKISVRSLRRQFGAIDPDQICIKQSSNPADVATKFKLDFGRHLNFSTAVLFHTLATNSGFHGDERLSVVTDDNSPCVQVP
jgi:hypothetical protein